MGDTIHAADLLERAEEWLGGDCDSRFDSIQTACLVEELVAEVKRFRAHTETPTAVRLAKLEANFAAHEDVICEVQRQMVDILRGNVARFEELGRRVSELEAGK